MDENNKKSFGSKQIDDDLKNTNKTFSSKSKVGAIIFLVFAIIVSVIVAYMVITKNNDTSTDGEQIEKSTSEKIDEQTKSTVFNEGYEAAAREIDSKIAESTDKEELFSLYMEKSSLYLEQNLLDEALEESSKAMQADSDQAYHVYKFQSDIFREKGDKVEALSSLDKAQDSLDPNNSEYERRIMYLDSVRSILND